jgi:hypothetical protein
MNCVRSPIPSTLIVCTFAALDDDPEELDEPEFPLELLEEQPADTRATLDAAATAISQPDLDRTPTPLPVLRAVGPRSAVGDCRSEAQ